MEDTNYVEVSFGGKNYYVDKSSLGGNLRAYELVNKGDNGIEAVKVLDNEVIEGFLERSFLQRQRGGFLR